jgi:hypothetical protein
MDRETTIRGLFCPPETQFRIPLYQRAYSWETGQRGNRNRQVAQFIEDLREHPKAGEDAKPYYLGHFLFERAEDGTGEVQVIDGQQRLTTVVLFFHGLWRELAGRQGRNDPAVVGLETDQLRRTYVEYDRSRKLRTVSYDDDFLRTALIHGWPQEHPQTQSARRIAEAIEWLAKVMKEETCTEELLRWLALVENAVITTYEVRSKEQATQIFAFQNDRGKDLTKLEKLKAFLMHQVYIHSPERLEAEAIEDVDGKFADIYRLTEEIESLDEDGVLAHHLTAFFGQSENAVEQVRRKLRQHLTGALKAEWIREFCAELRNSFRHVKMVERLQEGGAPHEQLIGDVLHLHPWASWPLLVKLMHYHHHEIPKLEELIRLMEIILFKLEFMSGKSANDLPKFATEYDGKLDSLVDRLRYVSQHGFRHWWDFNGGINTFLNGTHHYDKRTRYLLWKYENELRARKWEPRLTLKQYCNDVPGQSLDASIEHIMPQNPVALVHSDEFKRDCLHNLGNLVLMTRGRNTSVSNGLPVEKAADLKATTYLTQAEVVDTIEARGRWEAEEIHERRGKIAEFALRYWEVKA